jgi:hypothetical protein
MLAGELFVLNLKDHGRADQSSRVGSREEPTTMEWIEPPPPDRGAWDIDDVDVAGAVGLVSGAVIPMVKDAYSVHEGEPWYETWGRRTKWTLGIAAGAAMVGGAGYLAWRFLGRKDEPDYHEEEEE